jgi:deoxyribonuclease-4
MRMGVHVFVARGTDHAVAAAVDRGCEVVQIFSSSPRAWALRDHGPGHDELLRDAFAAHGITPVLLHAPYLVNIAAADPDVYARSVACLVHAAQRGRRIGGPVVVHAGRDRAGPRDVTLKRAAGAILTTLKLVPSAHVLIEPTSGGRGSVASTVSELAELLAVVDDERVGVCFDTCHVHVAGHDISTRTGAKRWLRAVAADVGIERIGALHCNDARDAAGSHRDRHWHIGEGTIGDEGFAAILSDRRLRGVPVVLETPGEANDDRRNLERARALSQRRQRESARTTDRPAYAGGREVM